MPLQDRIAEDLKEAMRQKDALRRSTLRMIRSAIQYEEINQQKAMDDAGIVDVLSRMVRQHQESIAEYQRAERQDMAAQEGEELAVIRQYLPEQISREELTRLARSAVDEVGATAPSDMGKVMGKLMPQVRGRADGSEVSLVVREILASLG